MFVGAAGSYPLAHPLLCPVLAQKQTLCDQTWLEFPGDPTTGSPVARVPFSEPPVGLLPLAGLGQYLCGLRRQMACCSDQKSG